MRRRQGRGGIRIATNTAASGPSNYGNDSNIQRSYQDLWNMGILRANNKSGLTGDNFNTFFTTTNNPGDNDYKLTSLLPAPPASLKWKGDFNADGKVDRADYVHLAKNARFDNESAGRRQRQPEYRRG